MKDPIVVTPYNPNWAEEFMDIGTQIREVLEDVAIRIDHIGSTSIIGLDAKPIIDIQISVCSLEPIELYRDCLESIGYIHRKENPELTKRYFRERTGMRRTHIHVREYGSFAEQFALLFRDYLRVTPEEAEMYGILKYRLKDLYEDDRDRYVEEKEPYIWEIMKKASRWSQVVGWKPDKTDL